MNIFSCIHQHQLKPSAYLEGDEGFWGWEGFGDILARARRVWCYYSRVMHAGFGSFPAVLQQCQLTSHPSSAATINPTCLSTFHPFPFETRFVQGSAFLLPLWVCWAGWDLLLPQLPGLCTCWDPPGWVIPSVSPKRAVSPGQVGSPGREEVSRCPCPLSLLLSCAMESSSQPCSAGWKM